jgi:hypothetical protein
MALTDKGYENILNIAVGRFGFKVDRKFIDENYETFVNYFPASDDIEYLKYLEEGEEPWWTFDAEANGGGISDTGQRDQLMDILSQILFGMTWPNNGDSAEIQRLFQEKLDNHRRDNE